jgi:hypothetical protein
MIATYVSTVQYISTERLLYRVCTALSNNRRKAATKVKKARSGRLRTHSGRAVSKKSETSRWGLRTVFRSRKISDPPRGDRDMGIHPLHADLDPEQLTAFEKLTTTYVLTFYDEATRDTSCAADACSDKVKEVLCGSRKMKVGRDRLYCCRAKIRASHKLRLLLQSHCSKSSLHTRNSSAKTLVTISQELQEFAFLQ